MFFQYILYRNSLINDWDYCWCGMQYAVCRMHFMYCLFGGFFLIKSSRISKIISSSMWTILFYYYLNEMYQKAQKQYLNVNDDDFVWSFRLLNPLLFCQFALMTAQSKMKIYWIKCEYANTNKWKIMNKLRFFSQFFVIHCTHELTPK